MENEKKVAKKKNTQKKEMDENSISSCCLLLVNLKNIFNHYSLARYMYTFVETCVQAQYIQPVSIRRHKT